MYINSTLKISLPSENANITDVIIIRKGKVEIIPEIKPLKEHFFDAINPVKKAPVIIEIINNILVDFDKFGEFFNKIAIIIVKVKVNSAPIMLEKNIPRIFLVDSGKL